MRYGVRFVIAVAIVVGVGPGAVAHAAPELEADSLPVPPVPVATSKRKVELPPVPSFALPPREPGAHDVREVRVRVARLVGSELTVTGYVTWIYDCLAALARPGVPAAATQRQIDDNPGLCDRPSFYLAPRPNTPPGVALWVVNVPRPANKREQIALTTAQLRARPTVPTLAVGDHVAVTGTFALSSPSGEQNSDGLLVYGALRHVPPSEGAPVRAPAPVEPVVVTTPPRRPVVPVRLRNESIEHYELCNLAIRNKQLDRAIAECRRAVTLWEGNHLAWYALGNTYALREQWTSARFAYDRTVELRPDSAMYQMYDGIAIYESTVREAARAPRDRGAEAALRELRAETPALDRGALRVALLASALCSVEPFASASLERARLALASAVKLAPGLPLAHYYLGRIYRELDHPMEAAQELTQTIQLDAGLAEPYIALVELYRIWAFAEHSLSVARQGTLNVGGPVAADVWYELGMAEQANDHEAEALAAFTRALEIRPAHAQAKFQRGQVYFRRGEHASAKRDLEEFLRAAGPSLDFPRQIANNLLTQLARKR